MAFRLTERHALLGVALVLVPYAVGCSPDARGYLDPIAEGDRSVYMVNSKTGAGTAGFVDKATLVGNTTSTITRTGANTDAKFNTNDVHDIAGLVDQGGNYAKGGTAYAFNTPVPDADGDGVNDDSFLLFTGNNPNSAQSTEYTMSYKGMRTPTTFLEPLSQNDRSATYTGSGQVRGAIGPLYINHQGTLALTADFGSRDNDAIKGSVTTPGGTGYDKVTFTGHLTKDLNDFVIGNVTLRQGETGVSAAGTGTGVGSFVGAKAGGVMGVFANNTTLLDGTTQVNIMGQFHGTTNDTK
jgi:hypothetical protein